MTREVTNVAASVRQRLLNLARERGEPFDQLIQYYAVERFLARLAATPWVDELVVKGATLLRVWNAPLARPTRDVDFHTRLTDAADSVLAAVREIIAVKLDDGLDFAPDIAADSIVVDGRYPGIRLAVRGTLAGARFKLQVDVGVARDVAPEPAWVDYPTLLHMEAPRVLAYAPETSIAEKFEAMVSLGEANSRLKDFYDVWLLATTLGFEGHSVACALETTFRERGTALPAEVPPALTDVFATRSEILERWAAFVARSGAETSCSLSDVIEVLERFLIPVVDALVDGREFDSRWPPGGPWTLRQDDDGGR